MNCPKCQRQHMMGPDSNLWLSELSCLLKPNSADHRVLFQAFQDQLCGWGLSHRAGSLGCTPLPTSLSMSTQPYLPLESFPQS